MRSSKVRFLAVPGIIFAFCGTGVYGQAVKSEVRNNIVVAEQPDCPMRLVPAPTEKVPHMLRFSNADDRAVQAFVLVKEHARFNGIEVHVAGSPYEARKETNKNIGVIADTTLSFDYVLFADGTSWGPDKFERSNEIANVLKARRTVLTRLTELAREYKNPSELALRPEDFGSLSSYDVAGPSNPLKLEQHTIGAWDTVINRLRLNKRRLIEAHELADKLQSEKPGPVIGSSVKFTPVSRR